MRRTALLALLLSGLALAWLAPSTARAEGKSRILYITTTRGFHHDACEYSIPIIKKMAEESGLFEVVCTDKTDLITREKLRDFDAIFFSNTTGDLAQFPLNEADREALIDFVREGKAFIGAHAATDTYKDWKPFADMIGGSFNGHPWHQKVTLTVEDPANPAGAPCPSPWTLSDEIYTFKNYTREDRDVSLSLDNDALGSDLGKGNREDKDYAIAWCKPFGKGRVFYTALGHDHEVWDSPFFQAHLLGGIRWALGKARTELQVGHPKVEGTKWVKIFDGEHLEFGKEWETTENAEQTRKHWTVQPGGILQGKWVQGTPGSSHLYYIGKKFKNFEYRADVCICPDGNSGMYFRCRDDNKNAQGRWQNWPDGYEAQVDNGHTDEKRTGTMYPAPALSSDDLKRIMGYEKAKDDGNFWFTQEVIAVGDHVVIKLNGKVANDVPDIKKVPGKNHSLEGYFAWQFHDETCLVKFKNIEVRELP